MDTHRTALAGGGADGRAVPAVEVWARDGRRTALAPGALDALRMLGPGRTIELVRSDGRRDRWLVVVTEQGPTPAAADLVEVDDERGQLTLTVCGGAYLPDVGGYERPIRLRCVPVSLRDVA